MVFCCSVAGVAVPVLSYSPAWFACPLGRGDGSPQGTLLPEQVSLPGGFGAWRRLSALQPPLSCSLSICEAKGAEIPVSAEKEHFPKGRGAVKGVREDQWVIFLLCSLKAVFSVSFRVWAYISPSGVVGRFLHGCGVVKT